MGRRSETKREGGGACSARRNSRAYTLEVSSPGIDRPLRTAEHFARFVGDTAVLKTQPVDGRGSWTGAIASVEGDVVVLDVDGAEARIPMDTIKRAHLKGTIDFGSQTSI